MTELSGKVQQKQCPLPEGRETCNPLADDNRMVTPQANKGLGRDASSWLWDQSPALYLSAQESKGLGLSLGPWMWTDAAAITIIPTTVNTSAFAVGTAPDDHSSSSQFTQDFVRALAPSTVFSVAKQQTYPPHKGTVQPLSFKLAKSYVAQNTELNHALGFTQ